MRITIATDAWHPQVNGVVRTLGKVTELLRAKGHELSLITTGARPTFPLPSYQEIRLARVGSRQIGAEIAAFEPDAIHIVTEGTIGLAARRACVRADLPFTTGYHTRFPELIRMRLPLPGLEALAYRWFRWFHRPSRRVMVPTDSIAAVLREHGFERVVRWSRGVDHALFRPRAETERPEAFAGLSRPIALYAGRVAVEKGLDDVLALDLPGTKVVVGDGPQLLALRAQFPGAHFTGYLAGEALAQAVAAADVFVFPSRTDTFGLVMIEALAAGVPVAAFDVPGPRDIVTSEAVGALDRDLGRAVRRALRCRAEDCRAHALGFTWEKSAATFERHLVPLDLAAKARLEKLRTDGAAAGVLAPRPLAGMN
jgi:glycosyltransferase involved in cell wall biosynthesis